MTPIFFINFYKKCNFDKFYNVYLFALKNYKFEFSFSENLLISFDNIVKYGGIKDSLDCSMNKENVLSITSSFIGYHNFIDQVYHFPSSDYDYGFVSLNENNRIKVSFNPNFFGNMELQEIFVVSIENNNYKWFQYDFNKKIFIQNDDKCLRCHIKMKDNFYKFHEYDYIKIKN